MKKQYKILFCPLNWGLGHASRMIPLIESFVNAGHNVVIGGNGVAFELLKKRFPNLVSIYIDGVTIKYGKKRAFNINFILKIPLMLLSVAKEHYSLKKIQKKEKFDIIISDNRPGLFHKKVLSVYITHQLNIYFSEKFSFLNKFASVCHQFVISKYSVCWIPDYAEPYSLSGKLSGGAYKKKGVSRIGVLSRFMNKKINGPVVKNIDFLCIISGVPPQREIFENIIINKFRDSNLKTVIIRGLPEDKHNKQSISGIRFYNHLDDENFMKLCFQSKNIICRSGYSTIMDLAAIKRKAVLVPTPGQYEQEYIASHLKENFGFRTYSQKEFEMTEIGELYLENNTWNDIPGLGFTEKEIQKIEKLLIEKK